MAIKVDLGISALLRSVDQILQRRDEKRKAKVNDLINSVEAVGSIVGKVDELYMALLRKAETIVKSRPPSRADLDQLMGEAATFLHQRQLGIQMSTLAGSMRAAIEITPFDRGQIGKTLATLVPRISKYVDRFNRLLEGAGNVAFERYSDPYDLNDVLYRLGSGVEGSDRLHVFPADLVVAQAIENADPDGSLAIHQGIGRAVQQLKSL